MNFVKIIKELMSIAISAPALKSPLCNSAAVRLQAVKKLCAMARSAACASSEKEKKKN